MGWRVLGLYLAAFALLFTPAPLLARSPATGVVEQWLEADFGILGSDVLPATDNLALAAARARSRFGAASAEHGRALAALGVTQFLGGEEQAAIPHLKDALRILRDRGGLYSTDLVTPYFFLGLALQRRGALEAGADALSRAQLVVQRAHGNNSAQQLPLIYAKAHGAQQRGELLSAEYLHRFAYKIHRAAYGETSPEAIAAADRLGRWLRSVGDYKGALSHYRTAMIELQGKRGPDRPEVLPLLRGKANAYLGGPFARRSFRLHARIVALMAAHPDTFSRDQHIAALVEYGDLLMRFSYERAATRRYEAAWAVADGGGEDYGHWKEYLDEPQIVRYTSLIPVPRDAADVRYFELEFDVSFDGRPKDIELADSNASGQLQFYVPNLFRNQVRFRPRIVAGEAVRAHDHSITMQIGHVAPDAPHVGSIFNLPERTGALGFGTN